MAYEKYYKNNHSEGNSVEIATPFVKVMRNVYAWMALGLLMTALTAVLVASTPSVIYALASSPMLIFALFALELGMVIWMSARIHKMAATTAGILFALYAVLNGVTMSFIFLAYAMESIATTFLITAGTFGAMTLVGYTNQEGPLCPWTHAHDAAHRTDNSHFGQPLCGKFGAGRHPQLCRRAHLCGPHSL